MTKTDSGGGLGDGGRGDRIARRLRMPARWPAVLVAGVAALGALAAAGGDAGTAGASPRASTGSISGRITEVTIPAVIGGVCIRVQGPSSGSAVTSGGGTFTVSHLAAGSYTVTADPTCGGSEDSIFLAAHRTAVRVKPGVVTKAVNLALPAVRPAKQIGVVPPAAPESNCAPSFPGSTADIDQCRALEGVGQLVLPSNYGKLTGPEQMLVIFNLERIDRGLPPVVGLSAALDSDAAKGAAKGKDPTGPPGYGWESIWAGGYGSVEASDGAWMYDDGYPGPNEDCSSPSAEGCWGHRNAILLESSETVVGGGGLVTGEHAVYGYSAAFLFVVGYPSTHLAFTWSHELRYFRSPPRLEPEAAPTITRLSPATGPASGGTKVRISGSNLFGVRAVDFGPGHPARILGCDGTTCTVRSPRGSKGTVNVTVATFGGTSATRTVDHFTYG